MPKQTALEQGGMNAKFEAMEDAVALSQKLSQATIELIVSLLTENVELRRRVADLEALEKKEAEDAHKKTI